jgi:Bacterial Ig-like domain
MPPHWSIWTRRALLMTMLSSAACVADQPTDPALPQISLDVVSGDQQQAGVGEELPNPLVVRVFDSKHHPAKDQLVNFRVLTGGGSMYAGSSITDKKGFARDYWTMGPVPGLATAEVRAVDPTTGEKHSYATFTAMATGGAGTYYTLTVTVSGPGAVTVTTASDDLACSPATGPTCQFSILAGLVATLTATPDGATSGAQFDGWSGDCTGTGTCTVPMDADHVVDATFSVPTTSPSQQIQAARAAPDGNVDLPIEHVVVTYVKPSIGGDGAGFFIQADEPGPALFVAVEPGLLSPVPAPGDVLSFSITAMGTVASLREAVAISGFSRESRNFPISDLLQDVTVAPDLLVSLSGYESELIHGQGTITSLFVPAGPGYSSADFQTAGVPDGLELRLPTDLAESLDLTPGCAIAVDRVPLWRMFAIPQVTAWMASEVVVTGCPAPRVTGAVAPTATSVQVGFDRLISAASVSPDGSQFTLDGGLTVTAAVVSGKTVTLTTSGQSASVEYTVVVASSVTDTYGSGVAAGENSATFTGSGSP